MWNFSIFNRKMTGVSKSYFSPGGISTKSPSNTIFKIKYINSFPFSFKTLITPPNFTSLHSYLTTLLLRFPKQNSKLLIPLLLHLPLFHFISLPLYSSFLSLYLTHIHHLFNSFSSSFQNNIIKNTFIFNII